MFVRIKNLSKKQKWIALLCAVALLLAGATVIPYHGTGRESIIGTAKGDRVAVYIAEHRGIRQADKECPAYDEVYGMTTFDFGPYLSNAVSLANLGVWGTLGEKKYVNYTATGEEQVAQQAEDLPRVSAVRYTLRVKRTFIGSLGWSRRLQVQVSPSMVPALEAAESAVLLLQGGHGLYSPVLLEHGVFTVDKNEKVYALSYMSCASAYDGKQAKALLKDLRQMRRAMGL